MALPIDPLVTQWAGDLIVASLRGRQLWRIDLDDRDASSLLDGEFGRLRTAVSAPDGSVWVLTSNRDGRGAPGPDDDRIVRSPPSERGFRLVPTPRDHRST